MNKIIFQIGLLLFFVSIVLFSMSGGEILDVVMRAFIVFIGATGVMGLVGFLSLVFMQPKVQREQHSGAHVSEQKAS
ncbi:MAG: hypothetical protein ACM3Q4_08255 [Acidobacteriota bacterium]